MIFIDPNLQSEIKSILRSKKPVTEKRYKVALKELWEEYIGLCKEDTRMVKDRDRVIEIMNRW
jgi:hypothetical protein